MIVGIDGRALAGGRAERGVAHYTASLTRALSAAHPEDEWRLLRDPSRLPHLSAALVRRPRLDRRLGGVDLAWVPAPAPLAVSPHVPLVLTLHDVSLEERPGDYTAYERAWHRLARVGALARRAVRVLAVSQATRAAALERYRLDPDRVAVVPSGVSRPSVPPDVEAARRRLGLPERWFLWVGAIEPRKAPDVMARAFALARRDGLDAELVVAGEGRLAGELSGPGVRRLGSVSDRGELEALYAGALAVVAPSWTEGYGFPPLEAAACGTPAVVSDIAAFGETLGDAAMRVPPGDEAALAAALREVAGNAGLRARLAAAAAEKVAGRTWERAAEQTHAVMREAWRG